MAQKARHTNANVFIGLAIENSQLSQYPEACANQIRTV